MGSLQARLVRPVFAKDIPVNHALFEGRIPTARLPFNRPVPLITIFANCQTHRFGGGMNFV